MRYLSLFSGIEAATQAWQPLGWECVAVSEIEPFPCAVLEHHYPNVPNLGDVTKITEQQIKDLGQIDLIVFGSPCQNLSVAGNRKGFDGEQSSLFFDAMRIINYAKQHNGLRFALWENVLGAFSSNNGDDFTAVVSEMAGLPNLDTPTNKWGKEGAAVGYNGLLEWSVLDAQWFGLAQRRKRVFALLDTGNWQDRQPILLEQRGLRGDTPPSRETRKDITTNTDKSTYREGGFGEFVSTDVGATVKASGGCLGGGSESLAISPVYCGTFNDALYDCSIDVAPTLRAGSNGQVQAVAIAGNIIGRTDGNGGNGNGYDDSGACYTLTTNDRHAVGYKDVVRKLMPLESERLQGFPDNFTKIPYRNKSADDCPNGVRYKALGNSMAVNVMAWIGRMVQAAQGIKVYGV